MHACCTDKDKPKADGAEKEASKDSEATKPGADSTAGQSAAAKEAAAATAAADNAGATVAQGKPVSVPKERVILYALAKTEHEKQVCAQLAWYRILYSCCLAAAA